MKITLCNPRCLRTMLAGATDAEKNANSFEKEGYCQGLTLIHRYRAPFSNIINRGIIAHVQATTNERGNLEREI